VTASEPCVAVQLRTATDHDACCCNHHFAAHPIPRVTIPPAARKSSPTGAWHVQRPCSEDRVPGDRAGPREYVPAAAIRSPSIGRSMRTSAPGHIDGLRGPCPPLPRRWQWSPTAAAMKTPLPIPGSGGSRSRVRRAWHDRTSVKTDCALQCATLLFSPLAFPKTPPFPAYIRSNRFRYNNFLLGSFYAHLRISLLPHADIRRNTYKK
jgi:hypothetical protein